MAPVIIMSSAYNIMHMGTKHISKPTIRLIDPRHQQWYRQYTK